QVKVSKERFSDIVERRRILRLGDSAAPLTWGRPIVVELSWIQITRHSQKLPTTRDMTEPLRWRCRRSPVAGRGGVACARCRAEIAIERRCSRSRTGSERRAAHR